MNDKFRMLNRYFSNRYSQNDYKSFKKLVETTDGEFENLMQKHWVEYQKVELPNKKDLSHVQGKLNTEIVTSSKNRTLKVFYTKFSKVAAILIFPLMLALGILYSQFNEFLNQKNVYVEVSSPKGSRTSLNLPDGSTVWLNGDSHIRYPAVFGKKRKVDLTGEAFFKVQSDTNHPFLVSAGDITVRATGTEFNVLAYEDEPEIEVILKEGKVGVYDSKNSGIQEMQAGYQLKYFKNSGAFESKSVNANSYTSWVKGKLIFENAAMGEIVQRMEHWYGVEIIIQDKELLELHFKATFMNESIVEALKLLKSTSTFNYTFAKRQTNSDGTHTIPQIIISKN